MKTAMKKIFSLILVAVLLVSAVPFQASAEEIIPLSLTPGQQYTVNDEFVRAHYTGSDIPVRYYVNNGGLKGETFTAIEERTYSLVIEETVPAPCATCGNAAHEGTCCATCKEQGHIAADHCANCGEVTCICVFCEECKELESACICCEECGKATCICCEECGKAECICCDECGKAECICCEECGKAECICCEECGKAECICEDEEEPTTPSTPAPSTPAPSTPAPSTPAPSTPAAPAEVTYEVHFSVDGNDNYWWLEVVKGKSVMDPGKTYSTNWEYLKKVGDTDSRVFMGWSTDKNATSGYPLTHVAALPVGQDVTYYAIYKNVAAMAPTDTNENGITNKDNTNKVYLHVYLNGNAGTIALTKDITDSYLLVDDKTSNGEIWTYLANNYYTAKDKNLGLKIDGLYVNTGTSGTFPQQYYPNNNQEELSGIEALRSKGHVHIAVMLKNAAVISNPSVSADSTNPKTGDMIFAPVAVLGLSASALAVLFFLNKKRAF